MERIYGGFDYTIVYNILDIYAWIKLNNKSFGYHFGICFTLRTEEKKKTTNRKVIVEMKIQMWTEQRNLN